MFIADRCTVIKDTDKHPVEKEMVERLDEMLNEYHIDHFFSLPDGDENGVALNDEDCVNLYYDSKDQTVFDLVYALWLKTTRDWEDERIYRGFAKKATEDHHIELMTVRLTSRDDRPVSKTYAGVKEIKRIFTDEGNDAWQLVLASGDTATYCTTDWVCEKQDWVKA